MVPSDFVKYLRNKDKAVLGDLKSLYKLNQCIDAGFNVFRF